MHTMQQMVKDMDHLYDQQLDLVCMVCILKLFRA